MLHKRYIIGLILIIALATSFIFWQKNKIPAPSEKEVEIPRNLTEEEKKIYQDRLTQGYKILDQYQKSATSTPQDFFKVYMLIGFQHYGLGKITQAEQSYQKAASYDPQNYNAYTALYTLYLETGENNKALEAISKAIELAPEKPDVWRKLIELKRDKFLASNEELNQIFQEAIKKTNEHLDVVVLYAQFLENIGEYQKSWELWNVLHNHFPKDELYKRELDRLSQKLQEQKN